MEEEFEDIKQKMKANMQAEVGEIKEISKADLSKLNHTWEAKHRQVFEDCDSLIARCERSAAMNAIYKINKERAMVEILRTIDEWSAFFTPRYAPEHVRSHAETQVLEQARDTINALVAQLRNL